MTTLFVTSAEPPEVIEEPKVIIETERIIPKAKPDVVEMLKEEIHETRNWDVGCHDDTIQVSYEDAQILMRIATAEAEDQGVYGMYLIMKPIINRVNSPNYPNTIAEVVFQSGQFDTVSNGRYYTVEIPPEAHEALALLEKNIEIDVEEITNIDEIVAFEATWNHQSLLRYYDMAFTYKGHTFYKEKLKKD